MSGGVTVHIVMSTAAAEAPQAAANTTHNGIFAALSLHCCCHTKLQQAPGNHPSNTRWSSGTTSEGAVGLTKQYAGI
jgi:hypothetical protein